MISVHCAYGGDVANAILLQTVCHTLHTHTDLNCHHLADEMYHCYQLLDLLEANGRLYNDETQQLYNNNNNINMLAYKAPVCQRTSEAPLDGYSQC